MNTLAQRIFQIIEAVCLILAAVFTFITLLYAASWQLSLNVFYLWALCPYLVIYGLRRSASLLTPAATAAGALTAACMLAVTLWGYGMGIFVSTSSTAALIFIFLPFYLLLGGPILLGLLLGIAGLVRMVKSP